MGRYASGDLVLAPVRIGGGGERKVRPVVVIRGGERGSLLVCPVSSTPSSDGVSIPISLEDFASGGLDLFAESYVLAAHSATIQPADVAGKKGSLLPGTLAAIREAMTCLQRQAGHPP